MCLVYARNEVMKGLQDHFETKVEVPLIRHSARVGGPAEKEKRIYGLGRASVERVNSRLDLVGLGSLKLRGLRNVMVHVLLCLIVILVVAVATIRLGRSWKTRSLSSFWW